MIIEIREDKVMGDGGRASPPKGRFLGGKGTEGQLFTCELWVWALKRTE